MCKVSGPVSTLPGHETTVPSGTLCDEHISQPATHRVQGETDSFGCEWLDMCDQCYDEYRNGIAMLEEEEQYCEWCNTVTTGVKAFRDPEEGMAGPVYDVCEDCRSKSNANYREMMDDFDDDIY